MRVPAINLARRPFRNNTVHYVVFTSCFALLAAASVYNVYDYVQTGTEIGRLEEELGERAGRYRGLGDEVEKMKADVGRLDLTTLNTKSNFANGLILSRLFSWSTLFDRIEELIPPDVKIRSIRPSISPKGIEIQIDGMARTPQALYEFESALDGSNFFTGVYPLSESTRESKTELNFDLMMNYIPAGRDSKDPAVPASPTAGLPVSEQTAAAGTDPNAAAAEGTAPSGTPGAPAADGTTVAAAQPSVPAGQQGLATMVEPEEAAQDEPAQAEPAPPPTPRKAVAEMTNKEFFETFGKDRFMQVRGKFGVKPPIEHHELNNADFIQKFGMEAFMLARGHLDRASQTLPAAVPGKGTPR